MKLAKCPKCGELIDLDKIEQFDPEVVIGCGQKEDNFAPCNECGNKYGSKDCKELRDEDGWTPTKVKDYKK